MNLDRYRIDRLRTVDLADHPTDDAEGLDRDELEAETEQLALRLVELRELLWADHRQRVLVVLQAIDGGGKDGTIRRVFSGCNPQGVRVVGFKVPTEPERAHDYLWRVHPHVPGDGELTVFNRSHYEDVLVVRVHELVTEDRWRRRYRHIRDFEQLLIDEGTTVLKFFLHISKDEQRDRLQDRVGTPEKRWKFRLADLDERKLWDDYQRAFGDMLGQTCDPAPWWVVPADRKWFRDYLVLKVLVETLEQLDLQYPEPEAGVIGLTVD